MPSLLYLSNHVFFVHVLKIDCFFNDNTVCYVLDYTGIWICIYCFFMYQNGQLKIAGKVSASKEEFFAKIKEGLMEVKYSSMMF